MATNFTVKIGEIGLLTFIRPLAFPSGLEYRNSAISQGSMAMLHRVKIW